MFITDLSQESESARPPFCAFLAKPSESLLEFSQIPEEQCCMKRWGSFSSSLGVCWNKLTRRKKVKVLTV